MSQSPFVTGVDHCKLKDVEFSILYEILVGALGGSIYGLQLLWYIIVNYIPST